MAARRWITPRSQPTGTIDLKLTIPNAPEYVAILRGVALDLINCENWEMVPGVTIAPCDAAAWSSVIMEALREITTC